MKSSVSSNEMKKKKYILRTLQFLEVKKNKFDSAIH